MYIELIVFFQIYTRNNYNHINSFLLSNLRMLITLFKDMVLFCGFILWFYFVILM